MPTPTDDKEIEQIKHEWMQNPDSDISELIRKAYSLSQQHKTDEVRENEKRLLKELFNFIHGKRYELEIINFMEEYRETYYPELLSTNNH